MKKKLISRTIFSIGIATIIATLIFSMVSVAQIIDYERPVIIIDAGHGGLTNTID